MWVKKAENIVLHKVPSCDNLLLENTRDGPFSAAMLGISSYSAFTT